MSSTDIKPTIIIDTREQTPLVFTTMTSTLGTLYSGDYSIAGLEDLFTIERKSIADLVSCCVGSNRERFERELHRLRGFRFKRLLIIGSKVHIMDHRYHSNVTPKAVLATLGAFEVRYDVPVVYALTPEDAASQIESWAHWFTREIVKVADVFTRAAHVDL